MAEGVRRRLAAEAFEKYFMVCLVNVIPWVLVSFPHVRYMARFYPLMLLVSLRWMERTDRSRLARSLIYTTIALQALIFFGSMRHVHDFNRIWRPD
jgi:hypothetical protein